MKKYISIFLTLIIIIACVTAFAADSSKDDVNFTQEELELLENTSAIGISPYSTGLISGCDIRIAKQGSTTLLISGYTNGSSEVVKCGFTKVVIQRKKSSSTSWSNYKTYKDLYSNSTKYKLSKSITVEKGYQYRVTATHYAKMASAHIAKKNGIQNATTLNTSY